MGVYTPALRFHWLTRCYDPVVRAALKEGKLKRLLIEQARIEPGHRVLDLGCGTGTLAIMVKRAHPRAVVVGLDPDPAVLAIARRKIAQAGLDIELREGFGSTAPFEPSSFDRVLSSLVFHHLRTEEKRRTLAKMRELLRPGGELHVADWGQAQNVLMRLAFLPVQLLDGFESTRDNVRGRIVPLMEGVGFSAVAETHREMSLLGTLSLYRAGAGPAKGER